eukprot:scaffold309600_cov23-Tisochrysis_lutea.AAC.1
MPVPCGGAPLHGKQKLVYVGQWRVWRSTPWPNPTGHPPWHHARLLVHVHGGHGRRRVRVALGILATAPIAGVGAALLASMLLQPQGG